MHFFLLLADINHPERGEKKFFCEICNEGHIFQVGLAYHMKKYHKTITNHREQSVCQLCGMSFSTSNGLNTHIRHKHRKPGETTENMKFQLQTGDNLEECICELCGFSTKNSFQLKQHIFRIHESEKHPKCPHCDFKTPNKISLCVHIDKNHPEVDEKKFLCDKCEFRYE